MCCSLNKVLQYVLYSLYSSSSQYADYMTVNTTNINAKPLVQLTRFDASEDKGVGHEQYPSEQPSDC